MTRFGTGEAATDIGPLGRGPGIPGTVRPGFRARGLILGCVSAMVFCLYLTVFESPTKGYWDTYFVAAATFMTGLPAHFELQDGRDPYQYRLQGRLPDDLTDPDDYGIISKDRQIGTAVSMAPLYRFFGRFGFRLFFALVPVAAFLLGFLVAREVLDLHFGLAVAAGLLLALNLYGFSINRLNHNVYSLMLGTALIYILLRPGSGPPWFLVGLFYGVMGGIEGETILYGPAICGLILTDGSRSVPERLRSLGTMLAGAVLTIAPILYWNQYAFGTPLIHPSQHPGFHGFRPTFAHSFLGLDFTFNGLLNYPFHSEVVRTPHFAFPTFMLFPLSVIKAFGALLSAFVPLGVWSLWRRHRRVALFLLAWGAPVLLLFAFQENWEEVKMTFILLLYAPLVLFMAEGIGALFTRDRWKVSAVTVVVLAPTILLLVRLASTLEIPEDLRWYVRFPSAADSASGLTTLPTALRNDWEYFHTRETAEEIETERGRLASGNLLPSMYLPVELELSGTLRRIGAEYADHHPVLLDTWRLIYDQQSAPAERGESR